MFSSCIQVSLLLIQIIYTSDTHTHTHIYIYIYKIGMGPTYHMMEIFTPFTEVFIDGPASITIANSSEQNRVEGIKHIMNRRKFKSAVDFPACLFYQVCAGFIAAYSSFCLVMRDKSMSALFFYLP